jgi:hypothetical protein
LEEFSLKKDSTGTMKVKSMERISSSLVERSDGKVGDEAMMVKEYNNEMKSISSNETSRFIMSSSSTDHGNQSLSLKQQQQRRSSFYMLNFFAWKIQQETLLKFLLIVYE